jgi:hypothetical protein
MNVSCPNCGSSVGEQIGGKLGLALAAGLLGSRVSPSTALVFALVGAAAGHYCIDSAVRTCPQCGLVFRIIGELPLP